MNLEDLLRNWGRYYRDRIHMGQCGSAEGNYRSNWRQWRELGDIPLSTPCDIRMASLVEEAWKKLMPVHQKLLKCTYMMNAPDWFVARKSGVKVWKLAMELAKAHRAIEKHLQIERIYATVSQTVIPHPMRDEAPDGRAQLA